MVEDGSKHVYHDTQCNYSLTYSANENDEKVWFVHPANDLTMKTRKNLLFSFFFFSPFLLSSIWIKKQTHSETELENENCLQEYCVTQSE